MKWGKDPEKKEMQEWNKYNLWTQASWTFQNTSVLGSRSSEKRWEDRSWGAGDGRSKGAEDAGRMTHERPQGPWGAGCREGRPPFLTVSVKWFHTSLERAAIPVIQMWHICSPIYVTKPQPTYTEAEKRRPAATRPTRHPPSLISRCPLPSGVPPGAPSSLCSSYPSPRLRCLSIPASLFHNVTNYACWRILLVFSSPF